MTARGSNTNIALFRGEGGGEGGKLTPTGEVGGIDRREHRRSSFSAPVQIERGAAIEHGRTSNLSLGGMLIEMGNPLWVGAEFHASIGFGDGPLEVDCVVKRVIVGSGMGVEFVGMEPLDRERLQRLLESLPY